MSEQHLPQKLSFFSGCSCAQARHLLLKKMSLSLYDSEVSLGHFYGFHPRFQITFVISAKSLW